MQRRYIRAIINVDSTEQDIPIGFVGPGQVLFYDGSQITSQNVVIGPATPATVVGQIAIWNNTTGTLLAASTVTASGGALASVATINAINPATWVVGAASAVANNIAIFSGVSGKLIADGGILSTDLVRGTGTAALNILPVYTNASGRVIVSSNLLVTDVMVAGGGTVISGNIPQYSGTGGRSLTTTGIASTNLVLSFTTPTAGDLMAWQGVGKNIVASSTVIAANVVQASSASTSSNVVLYNGATGRSIFDGGISQINLGLVFTTTQAAQALAVFTSAAGRVLGDSGFLVSDAVFNLGGAVTTNRLVSFSSTTGRRVQQTSITESAGALTGVVSINGTTVSSFVVGPGGAGNNAIAVFSGTTGALLRNSGLSEAVSGTLSAVNVSVSSNVAASTLNTSIPVANIVSYNAAVSAPLTNELAGWDTSSFPFKVSYRQVQVTPAGAISLVTSLSCSGNISAATFNGLSTTSDFVLKSGSPSTQNLAYWQSTGSNLLTFSSIQVIGTDMQGINNISVATINGIDPDNHHARHVTTGGGDSILQPAVSWTTKDVLRYSGAQFDPRHIQSLTTTSAALGGSFVTVANVFLGPNAGSSYTGRVSFPFNQPDGSGNLEVSVAWSVGTTVTATVNYGVRASVITSSGGVSVVTLSGTSPPTFMVDITLSILSAVANTNIIISARKNGGTSGSSQSGVAYFIQN